MRKSKFFTGKIGDASIVATVMLIVSAIAIAALVTTFSKQTEEKVSKSIVKLGEGVDCESIRLSVEDFADPAEFTFMNRGNLGIDKFAVRVYTSSGINVFGPGDFSSGNTRCGGDGVVGGRLLPQKTCVWNHGIGNPEKIELIPFIATEDGDIDCESRISTWEK